MQPKLILFITILFLSAAVSYAQKSEISNCYLSFTNPTQMTVGKINRLPESAEKFRALETDNGEVKATRIDGYRILYNNEKNVPFVNLKVELSAAGSYESDQKKLIENFSFLNTHSTGMETKKLISLNVNGYKITGLSRGGIEGGIFLGTFIMFPGDGVVVYFYFNNLKHGDRHFESVEEYKKLRNKFIDEYTKHLRKCLTK